MLDWRVSLTMFMAIIIAFALIWAGVAPDWGQRFRSLYESVSGDTPIISNVFNVYLDEDKRSLIYVKEECEAEDTHPIVLHLTPADINTIPDSRKQFGFDNLDFHFDKYGLRFDNKCVIQLNLPDYNITRIRTGQNTFVDDVDDELSLIWIEEVLIEDTFIDQ